MVTFGGDARLRSALSLSLVLLTACGGETGTELQAWTLRTGDTSAEVTLPAHLPVPDLPSEYRLTTTVVVPDLLAEACFFWPSMLGRARMTVDGQPTEAIYSSLSQPYRAPGPQLFCVNVLGAGPHRLELVVFHEWLHSGFIEAAPRMLPRAAAERAYRQRQLLIEIGGIFGGTWMSAVGFCSLVIFLLDRSRTPYGWFVAQAGTAAYYPLFMSGATQWVLGSADAPLMVLLITGAPVVSVYFTHSYFKLGPVPRIFPAMLAISAGMWAWSLSPFWVLRWVSPVMVIAVQVVVVYQLVRLTQLARQKRQNAITFAAAWVVLGASAWIDCVGWVQLANWSGGIRLASVGLGLFAMIQTVGLSREYFTALKSADERAQRLAAETQEVQRLNSELRRQIFERSKALSNTFAQLSGGPRPINPGDIVAERYEVIRALGTGGMGSVYEVERDQGEHFALKVMSSQSGVHRDLKPANVMVDASQSPMVVKLTDFGISSSGTDESVETGAMQVPEPQTDASAARTAPSPASLETLDPKLTHTGVILGTLNDIAPELSLFGSNKATPSSDIFSFGIIAYELLTKSRPYAHPVAQSLMMRVPVGPPTPLALTQLSPALRELIEKCVAVDPSLRPSAATLSAALSAQQAALAA